MKEAKAVEVAVLAVLFDLFETLITEVRTPGEMPHRTVPDPSAALGLDQSDFRTEWNAIKRARMTTRLPYADVLREICSRLGQDPKPGVVEELAVQRQRDKDWVFEAIDDEVLAMLRQLRRRGLRLAVVSNCSVEEVVNFEASPLGGMVDEAIWSFDEGCEKPDARIYRRACARLGVSPVQSVFVGDGSFSELAGATRAGLKPIWASWFVRQWPEVLAAQREEEVRTLGYPEAASPANVIDLVANLDTDRV